MFNQLKLKMTIAWCLAAGVRAIRTMAQTALTMITLGVAYNEINWTQVISVAAVSGIYSVLTSLATKLPEVTESGLLQIDTSSPVKDVFRITVDETKLDALAAQKYITLKVDAKANLSQE